MKLKHHQKEAVLLGWPFLCMSGMDGVLSGNRKQVLQPEASGEFLSS